MFTASQIYRTIEANEKESRKSWLLWLLKKGDQIWFWKPGYHREEILSGRFAESKVDYIHQNPVRAHLVEKEEEYLLSSACDFHGNRKGLMKLDLL